MCPANFPFLSKPGDVHHEAKLAAMLKSGGTGMPDAKALDYVSGCALALDMTRRDLQGEAKELGRP